MCCLPRRAVLNVLARSDKAEALVRAGQSRHSPWAKSDPRIMKNLASGHPLPAWAARHVLPS